MSNKVQMTLPQALRWIAKAVEQEKYDVASAMFDDLLKSGPELGKELLKLADDAEARRLTAIMER